MADKRCSRVRKQIDYSKFSGMDSENDFAEDDDFENFTPPVSKKSKNEKKPKKESKKTIKSSVTVHPEPAAKRVNQRKSLDDKLFEKELELALKLSKNGESGTETDVQVNKTEEKKSEEIDQSNCEVTEKEVKVVLAPVKTSTNIALLKDSDKIEILEENIEDVPKKRSAVKKRAYVEEDLSDPSDTEEEFNPIGEAEDSDSEFDPGDDDMDFDCNKKRGKKNASKCAEKVSKKSPPKVKSVKSNNASEVKTAVKKDAKSKPLVGCNSSVTPTLKKPRLSSPATSIVQKTPASLSGLSKSCSASPHLTKNTTKSVTSPSSGLHSPGLGGVSLKSPSCGSLRLGLSRNVRLKPLHANVKVTTTPR